MAGSEVLLSRSSYNLLGQLSGKKLHSENNGSSFLESVGYSYNERGWMNKTESSEFTMQLKYNDGTSPRFNGDIANQLWGTNTLSNTFTYSYDKINRLLSATSTGIDMSEVLTYDDMGNIASLNRDGVGASSYNRTGNRLMSIGSGSVSTAGRTYSYDLNGNALTDAYNNKTVSYNVLNLPETVSGGVTYVYDASGTKLRKVTSSGAVDYIGSIQYTNGDLDFVKTQEGIARRNGGNYSYEYNLKDHLGNVRVTFHKHPTTGLLDVLQRDDYYAFGKQKPSSGGVVNKYLYNGKERQEEWGAEGQVLDYGARFYDPVIAGWFTVDPLTEKTRRWSPYNYVMNNPLRFIDLDGREIYIPLSLSDPQRNEIMKQLSSLTKDKLSWDNKTGLVSVSSVGKGSKTRGTELINKLIGETKRLTIDYQNSLGGFATGGNKSGATNAVNASNGVGSNAILNFDPNHKPQTLVSDPSTKKNVVETAAPEMVFGHELIHGLHSLQGNRSTGTTSYSYVDAQGKTQKATVGTEELRTVGITGNTPTDITENEIRAENNQKTRVSYP